MQQFYKENIAAQRAKQGQTKVMMRLLEPTLFFSWFPIYYFYYYNYNYKVFAVVVVVAVVV